MPLFSNESRASNIRNLALDGHFDKNLLKVIFENCLNVEEFSIVACPQLTDKHFIEWARRGVRLAKLFIFYHHKSMKISDEGIIPILMNSGKKLIECRTDLRGYGSHVDGFDRALSVCRKRGYSGTFGKFGEFETF